MCRSVAACKALKVGSSSTNSKVVTAGFSPADYSKQCTRPSGWCAHSSSTYELRDCDGDGVPDPTCSDGNSLGVRQSTLNCKDSWPKGVCKPATKATYKCPAAVSKTNWLSADTNEARFAVSQSGTQVTTKRTNGNTWSMDVQFSCCRSCATSSAIPSASCYASSEYSSSYNCERAFDGSAGTEWASKGQAGHSQTATCTSCPEGKFAYHSGSHCCNVDIDKNDQPITFTSASCKGDDYVECPRFYCTPSLRPSPRSSLRPSLSRSSLFPALDTYVLPEPLPRLSPLSHKSVTNP